MPSRRSWRPSGCSLVFLWLRGAAPGRSRRGGGGGGPIELRRITACVYGQLSGLRFGFLEDPLCKVFALSKLLRKTPCSGLEPGKPLFQRFSWLRFFCNVKFALFCRGVCPQNRKVAPQATFWRRRRNFLDLSVGEPANPVFSTTPIGNYLSKGLNFLG